MAPERRTDIVAFGLKSILAGTLATCLSGAIVGLLSAELGFKSADDFLPKPVADLQPFFFLILSVVSLGPHPTSHSVRNA
jgi:hypothetical protein